MAIGVSSGFPSRMSPMANMLSAVVLSSSSWIIWVKEKTHDQGLTFA